MKVYIEVVILDNLLMTAAISQMSYFILGVKKSKRRLAAVSVLGAAVSVGYPFIPATGWLLVIMKIGIGVSLAVLLLAGKSGLIKGIPVFFLMTAVAGGLCVMINYMLIGDFVVSLTSAPVMPYCVCAVIVSALTFAIKIIWERTKKKRLRAAYEYPLKLTLLGNSYKLTGYLDTGNTLFDVISGLPVIVVKMKAVEKKLDEKTIVLLLTEEADRIAGVRYIDAYGIAGSSRLAIVKAENLQLYSGKQLNTIIDVMVGVSVSDFGGSADVLLHPAVIGGQ